MKLAITIIFALPLLSAYINYGAIHDINEFQLVVNGQHDCDNNLDETTICCTPLNDAETSNETSRSIESTNGPRFCNISWSTIRKVLQASKYVKASTLVLYGISVLVFLHLCFNDNAPLIYSNFVFFCFSIIADLLATGLVFYASLGCSSSHPSLERLFLIMNLINPIGCLVLGSFMIKEFAQIGENICSSHTSGQIYFYRVLIFVSSLTYVSFQPLGCFLFDLNDIE